MKSKKGILFIIWGIFILLLFGVVFILYFYVDGIKEDGAICQQYLDREPALNLDRSVSFKDYNYSLQLPENSILIKNSDFFIDETIKGVEYQSRSPDLFIYVIEEMNTPGESTYQNLTLEEIRLSTKEFYSSLFKNVEVSEVERDKNGVTSYTISINNPGLYSHQKIFHCPDFKKGFGVVCGSKICQSIKDSHCKEIINTVKFNC